MTAVPSVIFKAPAAGASLVTTPSALEMGSTETRILGWDMSAQLLAGNTPSTPAVTLYDETLAANAPSSLSGSATVAGNLIVQAVTALAPGHTYRVEVACAQGSGDGAACETGLACPW